MKLKLYQIDAFADEPFSGNPAAVCPLQEWLPDQLMQQIAAENNLSETAFYVPSGENFALRWFTPTVEVDLCGHATLATAAALMEWEGFKGTSAYFETKSGLLTVKKEGDFYMLDFPKDELQQVDSPAGLAEAIGAQALEVFKGKTDYMMVYASQKEIEQMQPDFNSLAKIPTRGVIVTAPGDQYDFVSRFFGPQAGVNEDPVTGSAHTTLTPYWAEKLSKNTLYARQLSARGGNLKCVLSGSRVQIYGKVKFYMKGEIAF